MICKSLKVGEHEVFLYSDGRIICTCPHGSLYPDAWNKGENVCKHIKEAIKEWKKS
jgi:hypothetical protein